MAFNKEEWTVPTPYGMSSWWYLLWTFLASLVFMLSAWKCWYAVSVTDDYKIWIGYWSMENIDMAMAAGKGNDNNYCVAWDAAGKEAMFDGIFKFGRALGVMGTLLCIPLVLCALYMICYTISSPRWMNFLYYSCFVMSVMSLLLLVGLASDICTLYSCRIGPGGIFAILDVFLWMLSAYYIKQIRIQQEANDNMKDFNMDRNISPAAYGDGYDDQPEDLKRLPPAKYDNDTEHEDYPALPDSENSPRKKKSPTKKKKTVKNDKEGGPPRLSQGV